MKKHLSIGNKSTYLHIEAVKLAKSLSVYGDFYYVYNI